MQQDNQETVSDAPNVKHVLIYHVSHPVLDLSDKNKNPYNKLQPDKVEIHHFLSCVCIVTDGLQG